MRRCGTALLGVLLAACSTSLDVLTPDRDAPLPHLMVSPAASPTPTPTSGIGLAFGAYVGDGTPGRTIVLPFQPQVVLIEGNGSPNRQGVLRTATMPGMKVLGALGPTLAGDLEFLPSGGMVLSNDDLVNGAGCTYYWIALGDEYPLAMGSYTGDGMGGGTVSALSAGFVAEAVFVIPIGSGLSHFRTVDHVAPASKGFDGSYNPSGGITGLSLTPDGGFSYGAGLDAAGTVYHWLSLGLPAHGSYVGTDAGQDVSTPFFPDVVLATRRDESGRLFFRNASMTSSLSLTIDDGAQHLDGITTFDVFGFHVGPGAHTQAKAYVWMAFEGLEVGD